VAFHIFVADEGIVDPIVVVVCAMFTFLILAEHKAFLMLLLRRPMPEDE
jgi:hypothetical protein